MIDVLEVEHIGKRLDFLFPGDTTRTDRWKQEKTHFVSVEA